MEGNEGTEFKKAAHNGQIFSKEHHSSFWRWIAFSVCVGWVPLIVTWLLSGLVKKPISVLEIITHGELLIVSIAIVAEALRDLQYANRGNSAGFKSLVQFGAIVVLVGSCSCFTTIAIRDASVTSSVSSLTSVLTEKGVTHQGQIDVPQLKSLAQNLKDEEDSIDTRLVIIISLTVFFIALVTGGSCKWAEKSVPAKSEEVNALDTLSLNPSMGLFKVDTPQGLDKPVSEMEE